MRRGMTWRWAIALSIGLSGVALARADEDDAKPANTGNWFTHLFVKDAAKKKGADTKKNDAPPAPSAADIRQKAQAEWLRRQEVCDKLRAIALECGDKDLARKADALDQRAWDLYVLRTGSTKMNASPDEQFPDDQPSRGAASSRIKRGRPVIRHPPAWMVARQRRKE